MLIARFADREIIRIDIARAQIGIDAWSRMSLIR
jgi:hypothetical protein